MENIEEKSDRNLKGSFVPRTDSNFSLLYFIIFFKSQLSGARDLEQGQVRGVKAD